MSKKELDTFRNIVREEVEKSHMATAKVQSNVLGALQKEIRSLRTDITPVVDAYRFATNGKSFIINSAKIVAAIGTISAGVMYLIKG